MARATCRGCWHPAPRGTKLGTWYGFATLEATAASPSPKLRHWRLCVPCARELGVTLSYAAPIVEVPR